MAKPNPEQRERTRCGIINAFWSLYADRPLSQMKVKAVTDSARVNRSTFYQYFEGLPDLLNQAEDEVIREICTYLTEIGPGLGEPGVIARATSMYEAYGSKLSSLMGPQGDPAFAPKLRAAMKPLIMEELGLDPTDPEADLVAECSLGALTTTVVYWHDKGKPVSAEELARLLQSIVSGGFLMSKGFADHRSI